MLVSSQMGLKLTTIETDLILEKEKILEVGIVALPRLALYLCVKIDHLFCLISLQI